MTDFERRLLNEFQRDLPLTPRPFAAIAEKLDCEESTVIETLERLTADGTVSRVGAVFKPGGVGESTLAAMAVPPERLEEIAELINGFDEVNHNYEREHRLNLWFVLCAPDRARIDKAIAEIEARTGLTVLDLPMIEDYHLDLGFPIQWD